MIIGVPKEVKREEYRVAVTPAGVRELKHDGHAVLVESGAGTGSGFSDDAYLDADADVLDRKEVFGRSDLIVKVKEPLPAEYEYFRTGQALFTYLHLAPNPDLVRFLFERRITALGYETLEKDGGLPLLSPMSEVAGRMAPLAGSFFLQRVHGGTGVLPTGVAGVSPAKALVIGAGTVGEHAARVSSGLGMETTVMNRGIDRLKRLDELMPGSIRTLPLNLETLESELKVADIVIGAVLVPGGKTPVLIRRSMLGMMKKGAVIVDVSVDQGGCAETTRPTTHDDPVYIVDGVVHYAVANMPGAYPRTSTLALTNATLPYIRLLGGAGIAAALEEDSPLRSAVNTHDGRVVHKTLAGVLGVSAN